LSPHKWRKSQKASLETRKLVPTSNLLEGPKERVYSFNKKNKI
jgi:hypothetical protein